MWRVSAIEIETTVINHLEGVRRRGQSVPRRRLCERGQPLRRRRAGFALIMLVLLRRAVFCSTARAARLFHSGRELQQPGSSQIS